MRSLLSLFALLLLVQTASAQSSTLVREFPRFPKHSIQGMVITSSGLLIQGYNYGQARIFDLNRESNEAIAEFPLGSAGRGNHANAISQSRTYYQGNDIPLLYVSGGQPNDGVLQCHVENIVKTDTGYRAEEVQRITLTNEFVWDMQPTSSYRDVDGFYRIWGAPSFQVDVEEGCLWVFSAIYRTTKAFAQFKDQNRYVVTKLRLPDVSEGNVTLSRKDVLDQIAYDFDVFVTQSGCVHEGKIYYTFGFGRDRASMESSHIRVYDLKTREIVRRLDFTEEIPEEFESCCFYQGELYAVTQKGRLYKIHL
jgi:hypothetical protein